MQYSNMLGCRGIIVDPAEIVAGQKALAIPK